LKKVKGNKLKINVDVNKKGRKYEVYDDENMYDSVE
jgi:hypothetical protein